MVAWGSDPWCYSRINHMQHPRLYLGVSLQVQVQYLRNYTSLYISFFLNSTIIIVDPTVEEENLSTGMITVVTDEDEKLCAVHKPGRYTVTTLGLTCCYCFKPSVYCFSSFNTTVSVLKLYPLDQGFGVVFLDYHNLGPISLQTLTEILSMMYLIT